MKIDIFGLKYQVCTHFSNTSVLCLNIIYSLGQALETLTPRQGRRLSLSSLSRALEEPMGSSE
jgi:hypothetical protein